VVDDTCHWSIIAGKLECASVHIADGHQGVSPCNIDNRLRQPFLIRLALVRMFCDRTTLRSWDMTRKIQLGRKLMSYARLDLEYFDQIWSTWIDWQHEAYNFVEILRKWSNINKQSIQGCFSLPRCLGTRLIYWKYSCKWSSVTEMTASSYLDTWYSMYRASQR